MEDYIKIQNDFYNLGVERGVIQTTSKLIAFLEARSDQKQISTSEILDFILEDIQNVKKN